MADLEAVLADVSYLMAMEMSKSTPAARASKKITLPDPSIRSVMMKYMEKRGDLTFDRVFNQRLGYLIFKDYCLNHHEEPVPQIRFYEEIKKLESLETDEERIALGKEIYDQFIMKDLLSQSHNTLSDAHNATVTEDILQLFEQLQSDLLKEFSKETVARVLELLTSAQRTRILPPDTFSPYLREICESIRGDIFDAFIRSPRFTRFCQWKNLELNLNLTANDFSVHRIIGRGGFGEVYGCRKTDTGKMYAMKCLDKKRIKMKGGESLALNERAMLSLVSTGEGCPFIVCMTYAFQTPEKLCFILDLMNGGDLHYHLTQHNVFSESEVRFYAAEVILGLEHMHNRFIVYRDLKPANILLDEYGHVRISDLGLACDFLRKRPHASVGTHGYMAPEVLQRGRSYDSSADWFSLGCMLYKLLRGHSPFRHHKVRDKHEIDRMTMTMDIELPEDLSPEMYSLLSKLLARDVDCRLGCMGRGSLEVREHEFFKDIDWQLVYHRKYPPPLIPPRGEVNAADAFDIGSFDEEDTKYIKLTESDLEPYKDFPLVVSERWQLEIAETVFDVVNQETDRIENKRRSKQQQQQQQQQGSQHSIAPFSSTAPASNASPSTSSSSSQKVLPTPSSDCSTGEISISTDPHSTQLNSDCIVEGDILKLVGPFFQTWQRKFLRLFPNRLEMYSKSRDGTVVKKGVELISMVDIREVSRDFQRMYKMDNCLTISLKNDSKIIITSSDKVLITQWKEEIEEAFQISNELISNLNKKAHKMYGAESPPRPSTPEQLATRTPTKSNPVAASESIGTQNLVRQTSAPSTGLQKSLTKLYSFTTLSGGMSGHFERSPARSTVGPIAEGDGETQEVYHSSRDDA